MFVLQESEGQKTNNGIQYRLQLLYANGEYFILLYTISIFFIYKSNNYAVDVNNSEHVCEKFL